MNFIASEDFGKSFATCTMGVLISHRVIIQVKWDFRTMLEPGFKLKQSGLGA